MNTALHTAPQEATGNPAELPPGIRPTDLPTPPQVALRIMQTCARGDATANELASLVISDPVITAELLRIVNSAFFGLQKEIANIGHALVLLGQKTLRNLVLCISVRNALSDDAIADLDTTQFWEDAIRRSVSARLVAELLSEDREEYFTTALLQDFGLLILFHLHQHQAVHWAELRESDPDRRLEKELLYFGLSHDQVGGALSAKWEFPREYSEAIGAHHLTGDTDADPPPTRLAKVLYCADWINAVFTSAPRAPAVEHCRRLMSELLGLEREQTDKLLKLVPEQVESASSALGLGVPPQDDFDQILRAANATLAEENLSYQELTWRLQNALDERDRLAEELNHELQLARAIQQSLLPPPLLEDYAITGMNVPARQLSGDFYDYFPLRDGRVAFCLGDVSGKGTNAAILMVKTCSLFRCLGKHVHDPRRLLTMINTEVCETSSRGMFVTMVAGIYDPRCGKIQIANAGHVPALLVHSNGTISAFEATALPVGIDPDTSFQTVDLHLEGGSLYMFSDGLTEARVDHEELGIRGLVRLLIQAAARGPRERIETVISHFQTGAVTPHDDLTLLLIEGVESPSTRP